MYKGEKVILRSYEKSDIEKAHKLFNDLEVQRLISPRSIFPSSYEQEELFLVDEGISCKDKERAYVFAIQTIEGVYIGGCSYKNLDRKNSTTHIGIAIADKGYWGRGYGTDAMKILIKFLFEEFNIRKILLEVFSYNERAVKCYTKLGFVEEGRLKDQIYRDGKYHDTIIMSLFRV